MPSECLSHASFVAVDEYLSQVGRSVARVQAPHRCVVQPTRSQGAGHPDGSMAAVADEDFKPGHFCLTGTLHILTDSHRVNSTGPSILQTAGLINGADMKTMSLLPREPTILSRYRRRMGTGGAGQEVDERDGSQGAQLRQNGQNISWGEYTENSNLKQYHSPERSSSSSLHNPSSWKGLEADVNVIDLTQFEQLGAF
ncbi:hypothetical protein BO71DRAFT_427403 [Aspergillus ellipticus CBS 707.79]|uniref:Uncharacterized protein n=1 Tax=Aspergillus ellipticus CBS 707.79 TaxID=1448320 RepID=A0A319DI37_9EURO|nr:hypothetical protein BO71DRAFT_427403 [Aspergillus ellipticus CBS 707.79]